MRTRLVGLLVCAALALGTSILATPVLADDVNRPHEGKVISIDKDAMMMVVQGEKDDQWTLYWTPSSKLKGDVTVPELKVGDKVHFEYTQKEDRFWLTELRRTEKAKG